MNSRRMFLRTLVALAIAPVAAVGRALGLWHGARFIVNGVVLEMPPSLDIQIEVHGAAETGPIKLTITGGELTVHNPHGPALELLMRDKGQLTCRGECGIFINQTTDGLPGLSLYGEEPGIAVTAQAQPLPSYAPIDARQ